MLHSYTNTLWRKLIRRSYDRDPRCDSDGCCCCVTQSHSHVCIIWYSEVLKDQQNNKRSASRPKATAPKSLTKPHPSPSAPRHITPRIVPLTVDLVPHCEHNTCNHMAQKYSTAPGALPHRYTQAAVYRHNAPAVQPRGTRRDMLRHNTRHTPAPNLHQNLHLLCLQCATLSPKPHVFKRLAPHNENPNTTCHSAPSETS